MGDLSQIYDQIQYVCIYCYLLHEIYLCQNILKCLFEILICRNWHYCWSKFYFYKKHYNYFYAFMKTFPNLIRALKYYIFYKYRKDDYNIKLHKSELLGLFNAYMLKKSHYRPNIN